MSWPRYLPGASRRWTPRAFAVAAVPVLLVGLLFVPDADPPAPPDGAGEPFAWDADASWQALQHQFEQARARGCELEAPAIDAAIAAIGARLEALEADRVGPDDPSLAALEEELFALAPRFGACASRAPELVAVHQRVRAVVKLHSRGWDLGSGQARDRLYRLLYGGRAAVEELLLQMPAATAPALTLAHPQEPSATPSARVHGVTIRSGDILVSRGGAPSSALIARGSDYPGNFSHVALAHVDEGGTVSIVESHIESGVGVSAAEAYLRDRKLRILVLRPRADLPQLVADPLLPHRAATAALQGARARHIPYDFAMDHQDPSTQFCSEVVSLAYGELGVWLWEGLTTMSSRGVRRWLSMFGVRHFATHGPSDLEYDPKLAVVAEWHDPEALFADHLDGAVIDAMLEGAERGDELGYDAYLLPVARAAKAWSVLLNVLGKVGPVPEGMSATTALRSEALAAAHGELRARVLEAAALFEQERGYRPPYWELVRMARERRK
jgi:hypothetical protein